MKVALSTMFNTENETRPTIMLYNETCGENSCRPTAILLILWKVDLSIILRTKKKVVGLFLYQ